MKKMIEKIITFLIYSAVFLWVATLLISYFSPVPIGFLEGSPTKGAEASRMVNVLRAVRVASVAYQTENKIAAYQVDGNFLSVLESYLDRSIDPKMFPLVVEVAVEGTGSFVGLTRHPFSKGIKEKLHNMAHDSNLINRYGKSFDTADNILFMEL